MKLTRQGHWDRLMSEIHVRSSHLRGPYWFSFEANDIECPKELDIDAPAFIQEVLQLFATAIADESNSATLRFSLASLPEFELVLNHIPERGRNCAFAIGLSSPMFD